MQIKGRIFVSEFSLKEVINMYFQLPDYYSGPPRYRYVPVEITPQNFHKNKRDDSMLIVDNPALIATVREEHLN